MGDFFSGIANAIGDVTSTIGSIFSPISGVVGAAGQYLGTQDQIAAAQQNLANANAFSAQQYATRYQTTVKDLQAAGLNPMLAYGQGAGSPPSSAPPAPTFNKLGNTVTGALNSANTAMDLSNKRAVQDEIYSNVDLKHAQMLDTLSHVPVNEADRDVKRQTINSLLQSIQESITRSALNTAQTAQMRADLPTYQARGDYYKNYGLTPEKFTQIGSNIANSAGSVVNMLKPKGRINYQPTINNYEAAQ